LGEYETRFESEKGTCDIYEWSA